MYRPFTMQPSEEGHPPREDEREIRAAAALRRTNPNIVEQEPEPESPADVDLPEEPPREYSLLEQHEDEEIFSEYFDILSQDFATEDPVEFHGHIYERSALTAFIASCARPSDTDDSTPIVRDPHSNEEVVVNAYHQFDELDP